MADYQELHLGNKPGNTQPSETALAMQLTSQTFSKGGPGSRNQPVFGLKQKSNLTAHKKVNITRTMLPVEVAMTRSREQKTPNLQGILSSNPLSSKSVKEVTLSAERTAYFKSPHTNPLAAKQPSLGDQGPKKGGLKKLASGKRDRSGGLSDLVSHHVKQLEALSQELAHGGRTLTKQKSKLIYNQQANQKIQITTPVLQNVSSPRKQQSSYKLLPGLPLSAHIKAVALNEADVEQEVDFANNSGQPESLKLKSDHFNSIHIRSAGADANKQEARVVGNRKQKPVNRSQQRETEFQSLDYTEDSLTGLPKVRTSKQQIRKAAALPDREQLSPSVKGQMSQMKAHRASSRARHSPRGGVTSLTSSQIREAHVRQCLSIGRPAENYVMAPAITSTHFGTSDPDSALAFTDPQLERQISQGALHQVGVRRKLPSLSKNLNSGAEERVDESGQLQRVVLPTLKREPSEQIFTLARVSQYDASPFESTTRQEPTLTSAHDSVAIQAQAEPISSDYQPQAVQPASKSVGAKSQIQRRSSGVSNNNTDLERVIMKSNSNVTTVGTVPAKRKDSAKPNPALQKGFQTIELKVPKMDSAVSNKQSARTKSTLRVPKSVKQKRLDLVVPAQLAKQGSNFKAPTSGDSVQDYSGMTKSYLSHTKSQQNLEPSMMAFLSLLKGKEDQEKMGKPLALAANKEALQHRLKKARPLGSAQRLPTQFTGPAFLQAQAIPPSTISKKKSMKQLIVPKSMPTSSKNRNSQQAIGPSKPLKGTKLNPDGNLIISVANRDSCKSLENQPSVVSPRHGTMTQTEAQTLKTQTIEATKVRKRPINQNVQGKQRVIQEKALQRKQLGSSNLVTKSRAPEQTDAGSARKSAFPFDLTQVPASLQVRDQASTKVSFNAIGQNVQINSSDPQLKKYLHQQANRLPARGAIQRNQPLPSGRQANQSMPNVVDPRSLQSKQQATFQNLGNQNQSQTDFLILGVTEELKNQEIQMSAILGPEPILDLTSVHAADHLAGVGPSHGEVYFKVPPSGTGGAGESAALFLQDLSAVELRQSQVFQSDDRLSEQKALYLNVAGGGAHSQIHEHEDMRDTLRIDMATLNRNSQSNSQESLGRVSFKKKVHAGRAVRQVQTQHQTEPDDLQETQQLLFKDRNYHQAASQEGKRSKKVANKTKNYDLICIRDDQRGSQNPVDQSSGSVQVSNHKKFEKKSLLSSNLQEKEESQIPPSRVLESEDFNDSLLQNERVKVAASGYEKAYKKAYFLPSEGDKKAAETCRLFFRRRHTVERSNLILIKASDLLIQTSRQHLSDELSEETCFINAGVLSLMARVLATNQIAVLIDLSNTALANWVANVLQTHAKVQVDAIYALNEDRSPTDLLLDVSQIVNDFRLFSDFQQSYKRKIQVQSLFTFVEVNLGFARQTQLAFNGKRARDYTHVLLGQTYGTQAPLELLLTSNDATGFRKTQSESFFKEHCIETDRQLDLIRKQTQTSLRDIKRAQTEGLQRPNLFKAEKAQTVLTQEAQTLLAELRNRNSHTAKYRARYHLKFSSRQSTNQLNERSSKLEQSGPLGMLELNSVTFCQEESFGEREQLTWQEAEPQTDHATAIYRASDAGSSVVNLQNPFRSSHLLFQAEGRDNDKDAVLSGTKGAASLASGTFANTPSILASAAASTPLGGEDDRQKTQEVRKVESQSDGTYKVYEVGHAWDPEEISVLNHGFEWIARRVWRSAQIAGQGERIIEWLCLGQQPKEPHTNSLLTNLLDESSLTKTESVLPKRGSLRRMQTEIGNTRRNLNVPMTPTRSKF